MPNAAKKAKGRGGSRPGAGRKPKAANIQAVIPPPATVAAPSPINYDELFASLPLKQQHFINNYLANGFNATKAAIDAGFAAGSADTQASRLLVNAKIKAIIADRSRHLLAKKEITADLVLDGIANLATFDIRKIGQQLGMPEISELGDAEAMAITGIDVIERVAADGTIIRLKKIRLADRGMNFERLGKYLKLFTQKVEHSGEVKIRRVILPPKAPPPARKKIVPQFS